MLAAVVAGLVLMLVVAAGAFAVGRATRPAAQAGSNTGLPGTWSAPTAPATGGTGATSAQVAAIAAKVNPAVVDVNTVLGYQNGRAAGTGVVLTSDGLILTNNHVVAGATSISVTDVGNGKTYTASVVGYDRTQDIAVLKLSGASGLATASLGGQSTVHTGDSVVAIGNAGGTGGTPSAVGGSVTALNQSITAQDASTGSAEQLTGLIEVAAAIQSGDSGGPLVNASGQVIGIDTAASTSFQYQASGGDGFAIPINQATTIAKQIESGQASSTVHIGATAFLGIQTGSQAGAQGQSGAAVLGVLSGSPAEKAGLSAGDVISSVAGQAVDSPTALTNLLDGYHPGDRVKVGWTDATGQSHTATVTLTTGPIG
jgi:S1-C subfamily serine protease